MNPWNPVVAYGYHLDEDGLKRPNDHEQLILCIIRYLRDKEISPVKVAEYLNSQGYRNRAGNEWTNNRISKLYKYNHPRYEYWEAYKAKKNT